jgi:hypothetical protein
MSKRGIILGLIVGVLTALLVGRTLSQTQAGSGTRGGYNRPYVRSGGSGEISRTTKREQTDASREASLKSAVGATDEQWPVIKPKLERVRQLQRTVGIGILISSSFSVSGGAGRAGVKRKAGAGPDSWTSWQWMPSWAGKSPQKEEEKLSAALFRILKSKNADPKEIRQTMDALRKVRERKKQELAEARKELREVLTLDQEARLVALGWLR